MQLSSRSAVIVVDMQVDFADPTGSLYVREGETLVDPINQLVGDALVVGSTIVYTQDWHPSVTPHFAKDGGIWPVHCVADTPGAALVSNLIVTGPRIRKGISQEDGYSGFSEHDLSADINEVKNTNLSSLLQTSGIESLVVVGLAGDYCVKATALDGASLGYDVTVPLALTRFVARAPGDEREAVAELIAAGVQVEPA